MNGQPDTKRQALRPSAGAAWREAASRGGANTPTSILHISYAQNAIHFLGTAMALWFIYGRPIPKDAKQITL
jgi:hypothetical protein